MKTMSLCPTCYRQIPAEIAIGEHVWMIKRCPEHGPTLSMVERDPLWFQFCREANCPGFYPGYLVDVTARCNLKCRYCYHDKVGADRAIDDVAGEIEKHHSLAPFFLCGGEPTVHPQLPEIIRRAQAVGETYVLTNGTALSDPECLDRVAEAGLLKGDLLHVGLSFHPEASGLDFEFLKLARARRLKVATSFWVIDDLGQIEAAIKTLEDWGDVLGSMRIKAASRLWHSQNAEKKIFVSDMIQHTARLGHQTEIVTQDASNKVSYATADVDGQRVFFVSWYDRFNVDLQDINCAPYYRAQDGTINNFVTSALINEREAWRCTSKN